jgi:hypothetical protein
MADTCEIIGLPIDVRYMLKVETLLRQISELNKAPIYDNAQLEQINNKLDY